VLPPSHPTGTHGKARLIGVAPAITLDIRSFLHPAVGFTVEIDGMTLENKSGDCTASL
jgi:hypothetical protein